MKILSKNKKAYFDYEILKEYTAGMVLTGPEIKSIRAGHINLKGSYVSIVHGEAYLKNAHVTRYPHDQSETYDPLRVRKLLLNKKEIEQLETQLNTQGTTVVALAVGLEKAHAKLLIGVARGRKAHDKRHVLKERSVKREMQRVVRRR